MTAVQRIALMTSGGDAPGMNAAVRAAVRSADARGVEVFGVRNGYQGMINDNMYHMDAREVSGILHLGGTVLGTARSKRFETVEGREIAAANLRARGIDSLVIVGGDGSLRGAEILCEEHGFKAVGIPGTIDNDLFGTDYTLGFDTAVNTAVSAIDKIRDTASSHRRTFFIEVMGRHAGWIAIFAGLASGATAALIPERADDIDHIRQRVLASFEMHKKFCIVVVAEGEHHGGAEEIAAKVKNHPDAEHLDIRHVNLGHMQRGGQPSMRDRMLGARLGDAAVTALLDGGSGFMVGERFTKIVRTPFNEIKLTDRNLEPLIDMAQLMDRLAR